MPTDSDINASAGTLELSDLQVEYGKATAVNLTDQSLTVPAGNVATLLGANGAGKSSLVNAVYGAVPSRGRICFNGQDMSGLSALKRAKRGIALVPQGRQLFPRMTVRENLMVMSELLDLPTEAVDQGIERFEPLQRGVNKMAGVLSGGEQQMLAISRALLAEPKLLLLDELSTGLAPLVVTELMDMIAGLARQGATIVLTSPTTQLLAHTSEGYVLVRGHLTAGPLPPDELEDAYEEALGSLRRSIADGAEDSAGER